MKILIFGASGSGTTTLAGGLARQAGFIHLDVDNYYWKPTNPPFQEKIPLAARNDALKADYKKHDLVVISGSLVSWGKEWESAFDLAIFLTLDNDIRMERLRQREVARYGDRLISDLAVRETSKAFLEWANQYNKPDFQGRSLTVHEAWVNKLTCPTLRLNSQKELSEMVAEITQWCHHLSGGTTG